MRAIGVLAFLAAAGCAQSEALEGYVTNKANGKSYKLVYQARTWYSAQKLCEQEGSVLAVPKTQARTWYSAQKLCEQEGSVLAVPKTQARTWYSAQKLCEQEGSVLAVPKTQARTWYSAQKLCEQEGSVLAVPKTQARTWYSAQKLCEQEGSVLAVPKTQAEFDFVQRILRGMYYPNITDADHLLLVWLGINNLQNYNVWKNVFGEEVNSADFHKFSSSDITYSESPKAPHCAGMDAANPGFRTFWCAQRQPYVCQRHYLGDT
ncbi:unnamed protein product [Chrysodeixis includens]|uniref:C-type lectin domain-containing protein n=1 Tax=Chrysodeixis includens TaxID=689277 RepID=A0A9N8L0C6_CHRIL|nr:unnamed protein product [Chrysodeixis includens]